MSPTVAHPPTQQLPAGPSSSALWQMLQWIGRPLEFMEACTQTYGDVFTVQLGKLGQIVFCSNPQGIEEILIADPLQMDAGRNNSVLLPLLGNTSLLMLDGNAHQRQRQLLMPPFHGERMRAYGSSIIQVTEDIATPWQIGQPFDVRGAMQAISLNVILKTVFGISNSQRYQALQNLLPRFLDLTGSPAGASLLFLRGLQKDWGAWSPWGRFLRVRSQLDHLIYQQIAEHRNQSELGTDILSLMLATQDEAGNPMTDLELRDELVTLLLAGHETTASALAWALFWIHFLPEVREKLIAELATVDLNDAKGIQRLPYLNAVCSETLRIYPIAPITSPRTTRRSLSLMGYNLPVGSTVAPCIYLTHRRPELYPNPQAFQPERFLDRQFSPYEYLPFGGSNRRCLGMTFALFEMKLVLMTLLTRYQFQLEQPQPLKPVRRGVTLAPPSHFKMILTQRC
ncbi:cytochrome P450 [Acaryochloris sp. IP29b_bin.137]|uniref:cytochrome P450 n=1 Tax=Acaryochloris sp. IP29b_bin.137 TaxID=2969217 RepID=UPI0026138104|nr:cytochrome P450 [Acaryochloris sp. IP29b_bin.137]